MEVNEFFDLLESSQGDVVENIKEIIQEHMNSVKEPWLVNGLFDYYLQSNSNRCMDVLIGILREPHDKFLIDKILEGLRSHSLRKTSLTFLGHLIRKQPTFLYKIVQQGVVKEMLTILKTDTDIVILLTGLLAITSLLPILPVYLLKYNYEIFDIFGRLTMWAHTAHSNIPQEHLLHLQVGLYSLFHRLYAMYPCNFLSYLRQTFGNGDKRVVFTNIIKHMLETVKMHPSLVTASKEDELKPSRWNNMGYDDIIAECALVSLDVLESGLPEEVNPMQLHPRVGVSMAGNHVTELASVASLSILAVPVSSVIQQSLKSEMKDLSTLVLQEDSAPPTPSSYATTTPSYHPTTAAVVIVPSKSTSSPPEAAMEATPENTPLQTPVKEKHVNANAHLRLPTSPAVKHLNFGKTPPSSIPSSPAPHAADTIRRDSIFDSNAMRRDSLLMGRLEKVMAEQQHSSMSVHQKEEPSRKPIPLNLNEGLSSSCVSSSLLSTFTTDAATASVGHDPIVGGGPLTPMFGSCVPSDLMDQIDDISELDELKNEAVPMPDKKSLMAFAQRVRRLRFYSHCITTEHSQLGAPSPGTSPHSSFLAAQRVRRSASCPNMFKTITEGTSSSDSLDGVVTPGQADLSTDESSTPKAQNLQPYEHLFEGALPSFLQHPGENLNPIESPHHILDLCISKAAAIHGMSSKGDELALLRGQVELLHAQLHFERHRREAHALRNRTLAKRCRSIQQQQERNYALEIQLRTFENEIASLKKELITQRTTYNSKAKESQQAVCALESKVADLTKEKRTLNEQKVQDGARYSKLSDEFHSVQKELYQKKALIFQLENEIKECKKYVALNAQLKTAYETSQKEIILLGELNRRQQENLMHLESNQYILHEMEDLRLTCQHEISDLKNMLEVKSSEMEAALGLIRNLGDQLGDKDKIISNQKKMVHDASSEYDIQIKALEEKYEAIKSINHRLELEILNLQHQVAIKTYAAGRAHSSRHISPSNGDSPHNSNHSDVDSAASAGGFQLSPEQSVFIFGSPQFGPTTLEMNDLQRVIGESETAHDRQNSPRRSSSSGIRRGAGGSGRFN